MLKKAAKTDAPDPSKSNPQMEGDAAGDVLGDKVDDTAGDVAEDDEENDGTEQPSVLVTPERLASTQPAALSPNDGLFKTPHGITPMSAALIDKASTDQSEAHMPEDAGVSPTQPSNAADESKNSACSDDSVSVDDSFLNRTTSSMSKSFGTPILEGGTPSITGKQLPSANKFADGITEHIPFENLPNSTGRFEEVRRLIESARKQQSDDED